MNLLLGLASVLLLLTLGTYFLFAFILIFHIKKYGMDKGINTRTLLVFGAGVLTISLMVIGKFAAIDWEAADAENPWGNSAINLFHIDYDRN